MKFSVLVGGLSLGILLLVGILLLLPPEVHHVGDTRYCEGTGVVTTVGQAPSVVVVTVPCGVYRSGDPDVTP